MTAGGCAVAAGAAGADGAEAGVEVWAACGVAFAGAVREHAASAAMTKTETARRTFTPLCVLPEYVVRGVGSNGP